MEQADRMFFDYLTRAYAIWLKGADETEVIDRTLLENFGIDNHFLMMHRKKGL